MLFVLIAWYSSLYTSSSYRCLRSKIVIPSGDSVVVFVLYEPQMRCKSFETVVKYPAWVASKNSVHLKICKLYAKFRISMSW